jgi:hypothetical protein
VALRERGFGDAGKAREVLLLTGVCGLFSPFSFLFPFFLIFLCIILQKGL